MGSRWSKVGRSNLAKMAATLIVLLVLAFWVWQQGAARRSIARLSPEARAAFFERTRVNLEALCQPAPTGSEDLCQEQARLLLLFPECDRACRDRVQAILPPAAR